MTRFNKNDEIRIARYVDGEMSSADRAEFSARLSKDAALLAALHTAEEASRVLHDARPESVPAPATFPCAVLDAIRCLPSRHELVKITTTEAENEERIVAVIAHGRRLLVAAVVVLSLSSLFCFNLLRSESGTLSAKAVDDEKLMKQLDEKARKNLVARIRRK